MGWVITLLNFQVLTLVYFVNPHIFSPCLIPANNEFSPFKPSNIPLWVIRVTPIYSILFISISLYSELFLTREDQHENGAPVDAHRF